MNSIEITMANEINNIFPNTYTLTFLDSGIYLSSLDTTHDREWRFNENGEMQWRMPMCGMHNWSKCTMYDHSGTPVSHILSNWLAEIGLCLHSNSDNR